MDRPLILGRLQQLTGNLKPGPGTSSDELTALQQRLTEHLVQDPALTISGNRPYHEVAEEAERLTDLTDKFSHLANLLEDSRLAERSETSPLVFRRETAFHSNLLGNSVPDWGSGMAVTRSFGPFIDEHGFYVWFDFYQPVRLVSVYIKGNTTPALLIPLWGSVTPSRSYRIEPGSVWIASDLIARTSSLSGYFTGLKVRGGSLELSENAEISAGKILISPNATAALHLDLDRNTVPASAREAGLDASDAIVQLPGTVDLKFSSNKSSLSASDASCAVFGCEAEFRYENAAPVWISATSHILIPYALRTNANSSNIFEINSSDSRLCDLAGSAEITSNSGWLLPATKIDPAQLGEAAGTGALCIGLAKGISANWKGLKGGRTDLIHPAIIAEPGLITVVDFFARNIYGKQKWVLWRNEAGGHHSEITLGFGKSFPFIFISSAKNSEAIFSFCNHKASFDRPVDANGSPFKIESSIAFAGISQNGTQFRAMLFDNDLLFDGNSKKADAFQRHSIILRNALFSVTRPYSLFLYGDLEDDNKVTNGVVALMYGVYLYLPTLPDPYVASYTAQLRGHGEREVGQLRMALAGFVKWRDRADVDRADREDLEDQAYVYFRLASLDRSVDFAAADRADAGLSRAQARFRAANAEFRVTQETERIPAVDFQTGVRTFKRDLATDISTNKTALPLLSWEESRETNVLRSALDVGIRDRVSRAIDSGEIKSAINELEENPLLGHIKDKTVQVDQTLRAALRNTERGFATESFVAAETRAADPASVSRTSKRADFELLRAIDQFMLLDVSSKADQMGVSLGNALQVDRDAHGEANLRSVSAFSGAAAVTGSDLKLQILNMDVVAIAHNLRAVTLPQVSWEPIWNIPLKIEGMPDPLDLITVTPGVVVYDNDGIPTRIFSESPYPVPITPLSVTNHFLKEYHDKQVPRQLRSIFTLPFALIAQADFNRKVTNAADKNARLNFHMPHFGQLRGGLQIKALPPKSALDRPSSSFIGWTAQLDGNLKWFLFGIPISGSTLGLSVKDIFNRVFITDKPKVPLEKIEFSGYGTSIFSNWVNSAAVIADVSQAKFDVLVGRTAHEVIQVRSFMHMCTGCVRVVRTITLMRSPNGYVFRSDSGWKAESDAFYNCDYNIDFGAGPVPVNNTYEYHPGAVKGVSNVREIRDYPSGGPFTSSFSLNESGLPSKLLINDPNEWRKIFASLKDLDEQLPVLLRAVVFDGDVHLDNVKNGGVKDETRGDFKVQSRKMLGYVQLSPSSILIPPKVLADLLKFQNGSLGGPVDCIIDIANSKQKARISRVDLSPALDGSGKEIFVSAARGSLILSPDGSWAVVKQHTDTGDVKPVEEGQSVPLIRPNGSPNFKIANPADAVQETASKINYGVLQSTGTQKLLFDIPQFSPNQAKLKSSNTYFADAYKLLNSKGVFPNIANALALTSAEKEVEILGEGLMKMADREIDLGSLLPPNYQYAFIDEPGILKIYAEYKSTNNTGGKLKLGIDSTAALADKWKAALSNVRVVVNLGPFEELMWVDGNFNASSGLSPKYDRPELQFGPMLKPVVDLLRILADLTGNDFDRGMDVGMSNSPDNWEYKFNCSKEIPVIQFPSPEQLTLAPNPPLKLEAGLRVGFYFNEVLSIPTDVKQLVPACGAFVVFHGGISVMCFSLAAASVYAVGKVDLGIAADTKAGISLHMKFAFGVELVVGLPVVGNASVLYMVAITIGISSAAVDVGAMMLFRGSAEICGGLVAVCIQIEAGGTVRRTANETDCIAQVSFSIDITILWIIDISFSDSWEESRQIA